MNKTVPVSCNRDCISGCPLVAHINDGKLSRITDNPLKGPMMRGCQRGHQMRHVVYSPERLKVPLVRTGERGSGSFREASWEEALSIVTERLLDVRERFGATSVMRLGGSGSCRGVVHHTAVLASRFLSGFGGFTTTTGNYSFQAGGFADGTMFGHSATGIDPATLQDTKLVLLWGANVVDTRFGNETESWLTKIKKGGTPIICIDPRRSRTVSKLATQWIPVFPGTDAALMAAVLHELIGTQQIDRRFIDSCVSGFEGLEHYVTGEEDGVPKTPAWASQVCGVPEGTIVELARTYGRSNPAALIPGLSIQRTVGGEEAIRMAVALQAATGNIGVPGGSTGDWPMNGLPGPRITGLTSNTPADLPGVPVCEWPDAILGGSEDDRYPTEIHAIYNVGGNYLAQGSDVHKSIRAFQKVDFAVCHDFFMTPTARHSDVVLPVTTYLEREDVVRVPSNYLFYSGQAIDPLHMARNDYDIFCDLSDRMGFGEEYSEGLSANEWVEKVIRESDITDADEFRATGIYDGGDHDRVGLAGFVRDPAANPLPTPSGKIEIASAAFTEAGLPAFPTYRGAPSEPDHPLRMVTPHARYRTNSQNANIDWFRKREEQSIWMNPGDAAQRGIADGEPVLVSNDRGRIRIPVNVTDEIMSGVVCLLAGAWPEFDDEDTEITGAANVLTSTETTLPSHGTRTHSVFVEVKRERGE